MRIARTAATAHAGIPVLPALNVPADPTSAWPGALFPSLRIGPRAFSNRLSHRLTRLALWLTVRAGADEWPASRHVVGTWFLDPPDGWSPEPDLASFLAADPPPVYIGFGSMGTEDPTATARLVLDAIQAAGVRAIVHRGWARLLAGVPTVTVPFHGDQRFWGRRVQELGAGSSKLTWSNTGTYDWRVAGGATQRARGRRCVARGLRQASALQRGLP